MGACCFQLINEDGVFNVTGIDHFIKEVKLEECGLSYAVVSIMGPQSSGKSTLLNHLFGTNFREMDAFRGRSQTTKGIWSARCVGIEPCTLVMDLEGADGSERGEDDTAFEKQSALFALAVSDILLINIFSDCNAGGVMEQAANRPLLRTVFEVMLRLFSPRKTTLMFVIRDKTRTPLENIEPLLRKDIQKIWNSVPKAQTHQETPLSDFFNVEVVALSNYEEKEEEFKEQVYNLRQRFFQSIAPGGLAGDRQGVIPANAFACSAKQMWQVIKDDKDLDLPAHKVMVATVRCEEICNEKLDGFIANKNWLELEEAVQSGFVSGFGRNLRSILQSCLDERYQFCNEKLDGFIANKNWLELEEAVQSGFVSGFGRNLRSILQSCLDEYDTETTYFEKAVKSSKRQELQEKLLQLAEPTFKDVIGHLRTEELENFKNAFENALNAEKGFKSSANSCAQSCISKFDRGCEEALIEQATWDTSKTREKLQREIETHISSVCAAKLSELTALCKLKLTEALSGPVDLLLEGANDETWPAIRNLLRREGEMDVYGLSNALSDFDIDEETLSKMLADVDNYARGIVKTKAKAEAGRVLMCMKDRFITNFSHDSDSLPRVFSKRKDITAIAKMACSTSLKLLSVLAAIRLDDDYDNIEETLISSLLNSTSMDKIESLASTTWEKVAAENTLITPIQCTSLWKQFMTETEYTVKQAMSTQAAKQGNSKWSSAIQWANLLASPILFFVGRKF